MTYTDPQTSSKRQPTRSASSVTTHCRWQQAYWLYSRHSVSETDIFNATEEAATQAVLELTAGTLGEAGYTATRGIKHVLVKSCGWRHQEFHIFNDLRRRRYHWAQLEDHRQHGLPGQTAASLGGPQLDGGKRRLDGVGGPEMGPMLGWKIVEGQQLILGETSRAFGNFSW